MNDCRVPAFKAASDAAIHIDVKRTFDATHGEHCLSLCITESFSDNFKTPWRQQDLERQCSESATLFV